MGRLLIQFPGTNTTKALSETLSKNVIIVDEDLHQLRVHDGVTPGGHIIGGGGGSTYHPDLFDHKWADHQLNHPSWLRADTFSWQSGAVYQAAYTHLADDIDGKSLQSETIGSTTIQFYLADDGHKICPASEESNVAAIYAATGVGWYYIIDTANQRFKLPRTQFGFTGLRTGVGGYVDAGLPDIQAYNGTNMSDSGTPGGAFQSQGKVADNGGGSGTQNRMNFYAHLYNSIYGNSDTVQPKATEMYLYFYVGNFTQTALENTAGLNTEMFNDLNAHKVIEYQAPTADNGYTWYRKYADGFVEQGGVYDLGGDVTVANQYAISLPVEMANTNYTGIAVPGGRTTGGQFGSYIVVNDTSNTTTAMFVFVFKTEQAYRYINWTVSGVAA